MKKVFADAAYWVAVLNPRDTLNSRAKQISRELGPCRIVTSEFVLIEMMKLMANAGLHLKRVAHDTVRALNDDPNTDVVPATSLLFREACKVYVDYSDKEWDVVDSSSYLIMKERNITEALTDDHHFQQMGFQALLRENAL